MTFQRTYLLALSAALAGIAHASLGTESLVTLRLTEQYTVPGTYEKDDTGRIIYPRVANYENEWSRFDFQGNLVQDNYEYQSRMVTARLGNREFLGFLVSEGVISSVSGWSLKAIYNEASSIPTFYITRPGSAPIYVGNYFDMQTYGEASAVNATSFERFNTAGDTIASSFRDESITKSETFLTFSTQSGAGTEGSTMNVQGMWQHTLSLRPVRVGSDLEYRYIDGAGSLYAISGSIDDVIPDGQGGFDNFQSIIEGSWLFAAGWPVNDLSAIYPQAEPAP
ncbi:hypothetical protein [Haloferula sp. BvORR071]|uniref:hypothetical protein n=1 Tax=Haloferula sp. BvORR071 TaxID=1396141 RepID=UPI000556EB0F|nr:hypothetical protein [Haloferula sp. BvORR071]